MPRSAMPFLPPPPQVRNSDFRELALYPGGALQPGAPGEAPLLRFALIYGFRNIQTLVRRMRAAGGCGYHYVEVRAGR